MNPIELALQVNEDRGTQPSNTQTENKQLGQVKNI